MKKLITAFFLFTSAQLFAADYFVSPAGNNANSGLSVAAPWLTIAYALNHAAAGDNINVMAGTYIGKLTWNHSGTPGNLITLQNYNDDPVILDGSTIGNNQALIYIQNKNYIKIDGIKFTNHNGNYQPVINTYGICSHIEISNCEFYNTNCNESYAILCEGAGDAITITNNDMHDLIGSNAVGVLLVGSNTTIPFSNVLISGNYVHNIAPAPSEAIAVNGNISGFEISDNLVEAVNNIGIVMIGGEDWVNTNDAVNYARNGICRNNTVIHANSIYGGGFAGGLYVDGGKDIVVENNSITGSDIGMEIGCENHGFIAENITVRNNLIFNNQKSGLAFGGYDFPTTGKVMNCTFTGNSVFDNDLLNTGFGQLWIQYAWDCSVENNLFYTKTNAWMINAEVINTSNHIALNYNDYFFTAGVGSAKYLFNNLLYTGFTSYHAAAGGDSASITLDPLIADNIVPDLHLLAGSPCFNTGNPLYSSDTSDVDMDGDNRIIDSRTDMGSDEFALLPLASDIVYTDALCYGSCNGALTMNALYGCPPYLLEYKPPGLSWQTYTAAVDDLCAGTYKTRITDGCETVINGTIKIKQDPLLLLVITSVVNESAAGAHDGKITVSATGGYGIKQYSINGGVTWQSSKKFSGLAGGSYTLWVMDAHNCIASVTATVGIGMRAGNAPQAAISPNPNQGHFTISFSEPVSGNNMLAIRDMSGRLCYSACPEPGITSMDLELAVPSGLYIIQQVSDNGTTIYKLEIR